MFPNLRWIASRSATPREAHRVFWGCVWPKNDKFWDKNQPGTLWNCKCDWEETDEEPDHARNARAAKEAAEMLREARKANKSNPLRAPGLEGNPAITGQLFTDTVPYIKKAPAGAENLALNITRANNLVWAKTNLQGKIVTHKQFEHTITFTSSGIKDYINQPINDPILKNELIRIMPSVLQNAKYLGYSDFKSNESLRHSHIFEIKICNKTCWLIVREYTNNDVAFYSISGNPDVLSGLIKAKHPTA